MSLEHSPAKQTDKQTDSTFGGFEPFVPEDVAAEFLNLSPRTLQRWRTEPPHGGGPPFYRLGPKMIAYKLSVCGSWAENRVLGSTSEGSQK